MDHYLMKAQSDAETKNRGIIEFMSLGGIIATGESHIKVSANMRIFTDECAAKTRRVFNNETICRNYISALMDKISAGEFADNDQRSAAIMLVGDLAIEMARCAAYNAR